MIKKNESSNFLVPWVGERVPWLVKPNQKMYKNKPVVWKSNKPFRASFKLEKFPNAGDRVAMRNTATDELFSIRFKELQEAFFGTAVVFGVFIGEWEFKSTMGQYYGLRLVK